MKPDRTPELNFTALAASAANCAAQWRAWGEQHKADTYQMRRAQELAALFDQQSRILHHMHHNRIQWKTPTRADFTGGKL